MNKWMRNCLAAGAGCTVAGMLLFAAGFLTGGKNYVLAADLNQLKGSATKKNSACELEKTKIDTICKFKEERSTFNVV